jgi:hypothetical protein
MCSVENFKYKTPHQGLQKKKAMKWTCKLDFAEFEARAVVSATRLPAVE